MNRRTLGSRGGIITLLLLFTLAGTSQAASIGTKALRGLAIGLAVKTYAEPLNKFINTVTLQKGLKSTQATKVVPILSVGEKSYLGGAQVTGPHAYVQKVQAVFQYEKNFGTNNYQIKVLVPSDSLNPIQLKRVPKVGVSAIIDVALAGEYQGKTYGTSIDAGDVIRNAAVLVAVKNYGTQINSAVNTVTLNKGMATKVIPMGSIGEKAYVGGAQVSASANSIGKVNAVWQYDDLFSSGKFRVRILVPATSSNPIKLKRVDGAGVTAVIDMTVKSQEKVQSREKNNQWWDMLLKKHKTTQSDAYQQILDKKDNGKHKGWYQGVGNKHRSEEFKKILDDKQKMD